MYKKSLTILVAFLGNTVAYGITRYNNLLCRGSYTLDYSDCSTALQASIPDNNRLIVLDNLKATYGACHVTVDPDGDKGIVGSLLSHTGQAAMNDSRCTEKTSQLMRTYGSVLIPNFAGLGQFHITWQPDPNAKAVVENA